MLGGSFKAGLLLASVNEFCLSQFPYSLPFANPKLNFNPLIFEVFQNWDPCLEGALAQLGGSLCDPEQE